MIMLTLKGVTKQYLYGARLFGALDLTVADGEIVAVYGGEGSGKTSFLKTVAGVEDSEGEILVCGESTKVKTDNVVMVFDDGCVFGFRSVFDNLAFPLKIRRVDKVEIASRVIRAAEKTGIGGCLRLRARSLSAEEQRRMSLARIFVRDAPLVLIDEPTKGLSKEEASAVWADLAPLLKERAAAGASVIFSTTDRMEAMSISDRVMVLQTGEVKQVASWEEIAARPSNVWAAQAIDVHYNVVKCVLYLKNGVLTLKFGDGKEIFVEGTDGKPLENYIGKEVLCGWFPSFSATAKGIPARKAFSEKTVFCERTARGTEAHTESGLYTLCPFGCDEVDAYPCDGEGVTLFDATNENSIMR